METVLERFDAAFNAVRENRVQTENIHANDRIGSPELFSGKMPDPRTGNKADLVRYVAIVCKMFRVGSTVPIEIQELRLIEQPTGLLARSSYTIPRRKGTKPRQVTLEPATNIPTISRAVAVESAFSAIERLMSE